MSDGRELGSVKWYAYWRKYVFEPIADTVYDAGCLSKLSSFCKNQTVAHKDKS